MRIKIHLFCLLLWPLWCWSAPLPENQVFHFSFSPFDGNTLKLDWNIKSGYFLYQERIWIENPQNKHLRIGTIDFPDPQIKVSKQDQTLAIYRDKLTLAVPVLATSGWEYLLTVHYQGCSDEGFCYPPQTRDIQLTFDKDHELKQVQPELKSADQHLVTPAEQAESPRSSQDVKALFLTANPAWILLSFLGFGLLLAFTPCVLPMVPVLSSIIIGHGATISTRKAFLLSLTYVLSMSVTYGIIGAVIALLGANLQILLQSPLVIGALSLVFVALALSMFGVYEFRLPVAWQTRIAGITRSHEGGHYLNAAIMGSVSILVLSPCVTPPLIGALSYIAETGSVLLGLSALFCLGLGMGIPLLLLGASAGKLLPKAGQWMNSIKYIFGMILLGLAIHLLSRLIAPFISMLLWSTLFITSGLGLKPFFAPQNDARSLITQAIGIMLIVFGGFILYGASAGHTNPWEPLRAQLRTSSPLTPRKIVSNLSETQAVLAEAAKAQQPVLLDFYATWCESCQQIEKTIMQSPELSGLADHILIVQVDLSKNDEDTQALLQYFHVIAPPTFLFYDNMGHEMTDLQWVGAVDLRSLLTRIGKVVDE